jgi:hypothetical protein
MSRNSFSKLYDNGNLKIEAYSLVDFLLDFQDAVNNGFMLDLESNEHYPQTFGSLIVAVLIPAGDVEVQELVEEPKAATVEPVAEPTEVPMVETKVEPKVEVATKGRRARG